MILRAGLPAAAQNHFWGKRPTDHVALQTMAKKSDKILVLAGAHGPPVGGVICARLDGVFNFQRPEALSRVATAIRETGATTLAILPGTRGADAAGVLAVLAARRELAVLAPAAWFPVLTGPGRAPAVVFAGEPMIRFGAAAPAGGGWCGRLLAAAALLLLAPLLLLAAIMIWLGDRGPVFFLQQRFGRSGRPFRIFKLRTMRPHAELQRGALVAVARSGRPFKVEDDPRATRFGGWLRRHGLDELPQLLNVARGEMRLVGPRPLPEYEDWHYTEPWHPERLDGLPGVTGLWQVSGRNDRTFDEMCILDIWYLRNRSLALDLRILVRTVAVVWHG